MVVIVLLVSLGVLAVAFIAVLLSVARERGQLRTSAEAIGLGAVTNAASRGESIGPAARPLADVR
jgi:hypothetical protein